MTAPATDGHPAGVPSTVGVPDGSQAEPPVPPGPGVMPPFVSPPADRDNKTLWITLGISAVLLVLCCVGGLVGGGVLIAGSTREVEIMAKDSVSGYLDALRRGDYSAAYGMLCPELTRRTSRTEFARTASADPVTGYVVGDLVSSQTELIVSATVVYQEQGTRQREYLVQGDIEGMTVCGER